mmetsp:Transcript_24482/g.61580  ORF Transcript_24482/g.61580 Transcript_24482/m.61580 type:complete len:136 (+) Transcript_24482:75-482(+)|eukprot:g4436.t1
MSSALVAPPARLSLERIREEVDRIEDGLVESSHQLQGSSPSASHPSSHRPTLDLHHATVLGQVRDCIRERRSELSTLSEQFARGAQTLGQNANELSRRAETVRSRKVVVAEEWRKVGAEANAKIEAAEALVFRTS